MGARRGSSTQGFKGVAMDKRLIASVLALGLLLAAGLPAQAFASHNALHMEYEAETTPPATSPLADYTFDGAIIDDANCYANSLYQATLGGAHVDLPFTMTMGTTTYDSLGVKASGMLTMGTEGDHAYGNDMSNSSFPWTENFIAPLMGQNSVWDYTSDGGSYTPAYYGFTEYDGHSALCATWLEVSPHRALSAPYLSGSYSEELSDGTMYIRYDYDVDDWGWWYPLKNSFQVLVVDRNDTGPGNFDIVFNYDSVQWQTYQDRTGSVEMYVGPNSTGGIYGSGLPLQYLEAGWNTDGGSPACDPGWNCSTGYSDGASGTSALSSSYWFPQLTADDGSPAAYLDSSPTGLAVTSTNSDVVGRHVFGLRTISEPVNPPGLGFGGEPVTDWQAWYEEWHLGLDSSDTYVALGDSFQSGEGAGDFGSTDSYWPGEINNYCHRSENAFPHLLTNRKLFGEAQLEFWACSGSTISDLRTPLTQDDGPPWDDPNRSDWDAWPDIDSYSGTAALWRLDEQETAVVTIGIGGNDVGFAPIMSTCVSKSWKDSIDGSFFGWHNYTCEGEFKDSVDDGIDGLENVLNADGIGKLRALIRDIHEAAPRAQIFVLGYPRFFTNDIADRCQMMRGTDRLWLNDTIARLDAALFRAAWAEGAQYINIYDVGAGHEYCVGESKDWFMRPVVSDQGLLYDMAYGNLHGVFHPNAFGHQLIADAVAEQVVDPLSGWSGMIRLGESLFGSVFVDAATHLYLSVRYPGSDVKITLTSPSGEVFNRDTLQANMSVNDGATWETLEIDSPEVGEWKVELEGVEIDGVGEPFHFEWFTDPLPNAAPVATATLEQHGATIIVDGSGSFDPDGEIVERGFDFGDGVVAYGETATHTYDGSGNVLVTMWVKDDRGEYDISTVGTTIEIPHYEFGGFTGLVGHAPAPTHAVAGTPIYLGFDLGKNWGNDILVDGSPTVQRVSCTTGEAIGAATSAVGPHGWLPVYNRWTNRYVWTWSTNHAWAGTCQELTFDLNDGSSATYDVSFQPTHYGHSWWFRPQVFWHPAGIHRNIR